MTIPERETPEYQAMQDRVDRKIMDLVSNVAARKSLPSTVQAIIYDGETEERCASLIQVKYIGNNGTANITRYRIGVLADSTSAVDIADDLIKGFPNAAIVCDEKIAEELSQHSLSWIEEDHYKLEGRPGGVIEVFTPYKAVNVDRSALPDIVESLQIFTE